METYEKIVRDKLFHYMTDGLSFDKKCDRDTLVEYWCLPYTAENGVYYHNDTGKKLIIEDAEELVINFNQEYISGMPFTEVQRLVALAELLHDNVVLTKSQVVSTIKYFTFNMYGELTFVQE